MSYFIYFC